MDDKNREEKFLDILSENRGIMIKISGIYARTAHDREDLMNDIVLELWRSFGRFKGASSVSTWLYRVALNTAMNHKRKIGKRNIFDHGITERHLASAKWLEESGGEQDFDMLYKSIEELDEFNKAIIMLYLDGKSHEEISEILGMSKTNVGTRIQRIKQQLKTIVNKNSGDYGTR